MTTLTSVEAAGILHAIRLGRLRPRYFCIARIGNQYYFKCKSRRDFEELQERLPAPGQLVVLWQRSEFFTIPRYGRRTAPLHHRAFPYEGPDE